MKQSEIVWHEIDGRHPPDGVEVLVAWADGDVTAAFRRGGRWQSESSIFNVDSHPLAAWAYMPVYGDGCGACHNCLRGKMVQIGPVLVPAAGTRMILCPECGNKRCPHASDHRYECTGSNEPGQEGSVYQ